MTVTYNDSNKKELKVDGVLALKAANGEGEAIITEIYKFSKGEKTTTPKKMYLVEKQKAWLSSAKNTVVIFDVSNDQKTSLAATKLVKDYLAQENAKEFSTTTGGITTTDSGVALATDTGKALQLHESKEKNVAKK